MVRPEDVEQAWTWRQQLARVSLMAGNGASPEVAAAAIDVQLPQSG